MDRDKPDRVPTVNLLTLQTGGAQVSRSPRTCPRYSASQVSEEQWDIKVERLVPWGCGDNDGCKGLHRKLM